MTDLLKFTTSRGRELVWRTYGPTEGFPVIFFHGNLNSRLYEPAWEKTAQQTKDANVRVIALDRPGYGYSTFDPDRTYLSTAEDVKELVAHLGLRRMAVVGYSSGGPNALACACRLPPEVLSACAVVSGDGPYHAMGIVERLFGNASPSPDYFLKRSAKAAESLRKAYSSMQKEERKAMALSDLENATRQGLECGPSQDGVLETRPWGFDLSAIRVPVFIWHGTDDDDVPVMAAKYMAERIPRCTLNVIDGENHTMIRRRWFDVLKALVADSPSRL